MGFPGVLVPFTLNDMFTCYKYNSRSILVKLAEYIHSNSARAIYQ